MICVFVGIFYEFLNRKIPTVLSVESTSSFW